MWLLRAVVSLFCGERGGRKDGEACPWSLIHSCIPLQLATMQMMDGLPGLNGPRVL